MADLRLEIEKDWGSPNATVRVRAGNIRCTIEIPDASQPLPITSDDRAVMLGIRTALLAEGAAKGMLYGQLASYFLFALARHVQYTMEAEGPRLRLAGIDLAERIPEGDPRVPRLTGLVAL